MAEKDDKKRKYATLEEAEAAYAELEKKLGSQGTELGTLRQQIEQAQAIQGQLQQWAPVINWYAQNQQEVQRRWRLFEQAQAVMQQQGQRGTAPQQAQAVAEQVPGYQFMTPAEKQQLLGEVTQHVAQNLFAPWVQQRLLPSAQNLFKTFADRQAAQHKSFTDVLWQTFQQVLPPDAVERARSWHEEALKYADPARIDPMALARDVLSIRGENATLKQQVAEAQKRQEAAASAAVPSLGGGDTRLLRPSGAAETPTTREDRFQHVIDAVKTEHGAEGLNAFLGSH